MQEDVPNWEYVQVLCDPKAFLGMILDKNKSGVSCGPKISLLGLNYDESSFRQSTGISRCEAGSSE